MNRMKNAWESRTVYSTDHGQMCPMCSKPGTVCDCRKQRPNGGAPPGDGIVRIGRETKGRKGKGVTVIRGVPLAGEALRQFVTQLKQHCGSGGTVKDGVIEIQGDHRDRLVEVLKQRGYTVKRAGG